MKKVFFFLLAQLTFFNVFAQTDSILIKRIWGINVGVITSSTYTQKGGRLVVEFKDDNQNTLNDSSVLSTRAFNYRFSGFFEGTKDFVVMLGASYNPSRKRINESFLGAYFYLNDEGSFHYRIGFELSRIVEEIGLKPYTTASNFKFGSNSLPSTIKIIHPSIRSEAILISPSFMVDLPFNKRFGCKALVSYAFLTGEKTGLRLKYEESGTNQLLDFKAVEYQNLKISFASKVIGFEESIWKESLRFSVGVYWNITTFNKRVPISSSNSYDDPYSGGLQQ